MASGVFVAFNILKLVFLIAALVMIGIVLIGSKKKRREQMHEQLHQLIEETDLENRKEE